MSNNLSVLKEYQGIRQYLDMMYAKSARHAPVTNDAGVLTGIVSTDDLVLLMADEMESYTKLIRKYFAGMRL